MSATTPQPAPGPETIERLIDRLQAITIELAQIRAQMRRPALPGDQIRCDNCAFYVASGSAYAASRCHRNPPQSTGFPPVHWNHFCAEFALHPEKRK